MNLGVNPLSASSHPRDAKSRILPEAGLPHVCNGEDDAFSPATQVETKLYEEGHLSGSVGRACCP